MFFYNSLDSVKYALGSQLRTAEGRTNLINAAVKVIQDEIKRSNESMPDLHVQGHLLQAVMLKCDGTEGIDMTAVQSILADVKTLGKDIWVTNKDDAEGLQHLREMVSFIETFPAGKLSDEDLHALTTK